MIISWPVHTLTVTSPSDLAMAGAAGSFRQVPAGALAAVAVRARWLAVPVTAAPVAVSAPAPA